MHIAAIWLQDLKCVTLCSQSLALLLLPPYSNAVYCISVSSISALWPSVCVFLLHWILLWWQVFYSLVCNTQLFCTFQRVAETMNVEGEVSLLIDSPSSKGASAKKTSGQEKGQTDRKTATKVSRHMLGYVTQETWQVVKLAQVVRHFFTWSMAVVLPTNQRCKRGQYWKNPIGFVQSKYSRSSFSATKLQLLPFLSDSKHSNLIITIWKFCMI